MERILVTCFSQTGNTERVAKVIQEIAQSEGHEVQLKDFKDITVDNLLDYDLVFLGSACHSSTLAEPVLGLLNAIPVGSRLRMAGFVTHSCPLPDGSERNRELYEKWAAG